MGPTKKTYGNLTKRRTLNPAPPIHTLRKNDPFDKLIHSDSSKSNIFQSSSEGNFSAEDTSKPKFFIGKTNVNSETKDPSYSGDDSFILSNLERERKRQERREKMKTKIGEKKIRKTKNVERKFKGLVITKCSPSTIIKPFPQQSCTSTPLLPKIVKFTNICSPIVKITNDKKYVNNLTKKFDSLKVTCPKTFSAHISKMDVSKDAESPNKSVEKKFNLKEESILSVHESTVDMSYEVFQIQNKTEEMEFVKTENIIVDYETSPYKSVANFSVSESDAFLVSSTPSTVSKRLEKFDSLTKNDIDPIQLTPKFTKETSPFQGALKKFSLSKNDIDSYKLTSKHSILEKSSSTESEKSPVDKTDFKLIPKRSDSPASKHSLLEKSSSTDSEKSFIEKTDYDESESSFEPSPSEMSRSFMDELALEKLTGFDDDYYDHSPTRRSRNLPLYDRYDRTSPLDPLPENQEYFEKIEKSPADSDDSCKTPPLRIKKRLSKERSPTRRSNISRPTIIPELNKVIEESENNSCMLETEDELMPMEHFVLPAGKKYRRSLSIIRHLDGETTLNARGRNFENSIEQVIKLQTPTEKNEMSPINILKKKISIRRSSLLKQFTPPPRRRSRLALQLPCSPNLYYSRNTSILKESYEIKNSPRLNSINLGTSEFQKMTSRIEGLMDKKSHTSSPETTDPLEDNSEVVFLLCTPKQNEPIEFNDILPSEAYAGSSKIGEGVYGEVFFVARENRKNVLKIIPIEGDFLVNDEKQKTYSEIYSELLITRWLNELRGNVEGFLAMGFAELIQANVVRGSYPKQLISLWEEYDQVKGSDNDNPSIFGDNQLFLILELAHAGTDLESYSFSTARQALSIFKQIAFNLAVAEACLEFEHRDLHWGNILISGTTERQMTYKIHEDEYKIATNGVKATIIDFTLSRITFNGEEEIQIYYDVGKEPDMFIANGDYQFDIYRHMRKDLNNEWSQYQPKTNVRWLHYVLDKMIKKVKYRRKTAKVHKDSMKTLEDIESWILDCDNSLEVGVKLAE